MNFIFGALGARAAEWSIVSLKFRECSSWLSISIFLGKSNDHSSLHVIAVVVVARGYVTKVTSIQGS